jgi:hypothetical protein
MTSRFVSYFKISLKAIEKFESSLSCNENKTTFFHCSIAWYCLLLLEAEENDWTDHYGLCFDPTHPNTKMAEECLISAEKSDTNNSMVVCLHAMFLFKKRDFRRSEMLFMRSIELDRKNTYVVIQYSNYLDQVGFTEESNQIFQRIQIEKAIISPLTCMEEMSYFRIFSEDGSFKSVAVTPSMTALDICVLVCKARNLQYHRCSWSLFRIISSADLTGFSPNEWQNDFSKSVNLSFLHWLFVFFDFSSDGRKFRIRRRGSSVDRPSTTEQPLVSLHESSLPSSGLMSFFCSEYFLLNRLFFFVQAIDTSLLLISSLSLSSPKQRKFTALRMDPIIDGLSLTKAMKTQSPPPRRPAVREGSKNVVLNVDPLSLSSSVAPELHMTALLSPRGRPKSVQVRTNLQAVFDDFKNDRNITSTTCVATSADRSVSSGAYQSPPPSRKPIPPLRSSPQISPLLSPRLSSHSPTASSIVPKQSNSSSSPSQSLLGHSVIELPKTAMALERISDPHGSSKSAHLQLDQWRSLLGRLEHYPKVVLTTPQLLKNFTEYFEEMCRSATERLPLLYFLPLVMETSFFAEYMCENLFFSNPSSFLSILTSWVCYFPLDLVDETSLFQMKHESGKFSISSCAEILRDKLRRTESEKEIVTAKISVHTFCR